MKKVTPETSLKRAMKDAMKAYGWFAYPNTAGLGSYRGISDFTAIKDGTTVYIEAKSPNGKQRPEQRAFQCDIEAHGGMYVIFDNIDDFLEWLRAWG